MSVTVFELRVKVYLLKEIPQKEALSAISKLIDSALAGDDEYLKMHQTNQFMPYVHDGLYPFKLNQPYQKGSVYCFRVRTISRNLALYLKRALPYATDETFKGLEAELTPIPRRPIEKIYSITPCVIKCDQGYWRAHLDTDQYRQRLKVNLIKKYRQLIGQSMPEEFELFRCVQFKNHKPVGLPCKEVLLLGDKLEAMPEENDSAQTLAYLALGVGLGELGARGAGFVGFQFYDDREAVQ